MSRRRKRDMHANHERWLVSYADFITLLFAFFVVLYASSQMDKAKMGKLAVAIEGAFRQMGVFNKNASLVAGEETVAAEAVDMPIEPQIENGGPTSARTRQMWGADASKRIEAEPPSTALPPDVNQNGFTKLQMRALKRELEKVLAAEIKRREVGLRIGPEGLVVSLREMGFFDSGSSVLKPRSEAALGRIAILLREKDSSLRVEGHTDNVPIHTAQFNSNWELSTARATEIIKLLIAKYQFPPERLSAAGYGEFHPVAANTSAEGRRQNRRLDLVILAAAEHDAARTKADSRSANESNALRTPSAAH